MKHEYRSTWAALALACLALASAGCSSGDLGDLETYVTEVRSRGGGKIEPLPEIRPYERYLYASAEAGSRDPFQPFFQAKRGPQIDRQLSDAQRRFIEEMETHNPEELENFELDSLRMVGNLQNEQELWGIVLDTDSTVHRVKVGNYMGRNFGKITSIGEDKIELREIINDGQGGWDERPASLALNTE
jgi:type IV pilus assembly protein PilP